MTGIQGGLYSFALLRLYATSRTLKSPFRVKVDSEGKRRCGNRFTYQGSKRCMLVFLNPGANFSKGVSTLSDQACISSDPPRHSWIALWQYCLRLTRFLPLTAVNVYSLLPYLELGNKLKGGKIGHPPLPQGQAMQHPVCGVPRILLLRGSMNRVDLWISDPANGQL